MMPQNMAFTSLSQLTREVACHGILCYTIVFPGRKSGFRSGCRQDSNQDSIKTGPPAGRRPAGGPIVMFSQLESNQIRPGNPICGPEALLRNIWYEI